MHIRLGTLLTRPVGQPDHAHSQVRPLCAVASPNLLDLDAERLADLRVLAGVGGFRGYLSVRVRGIGASSSSKARRWVGVGLVIFSMCCPAKLIVSRLSVARWLSRS